MKYFAKAMAAFSAGSGLGTLTQVAKGKLSAVLLGADGVGILSQLTSAWNLLYSLSGLGFYNGIVRRISEAKAAEDSDAIARQLSTSLILLTSFSSVTALGCVAAAAPISHLLFADQGEKAWLVALTLISVPLGITAQTYKGLLSGHRLVRPIVMAQVVSDLLGLVAFVVLISSARLVGAAIAFSVLQLLKLLVQFKTVNSALGPASTRASLADFDWREARINVSFGVNSLLMTSLSVFAFLLISRWIIDSAGIEENGRFSVAWKVASVYFGALYASAGAFYFPTLASCVDERELRHKVNEAMVLYFYIIPPVVIGLMISGKLLMLLLFSSEFVAAAYFLAFLLAGDLFRIIAEAVGMAFLAKGRLIPYTSTYVAWAVSFVVLSYAALPRYGVVGVAGAYLVSQIFNAVCVYLVARRVFTFQVSRHALHVIIVGMVATALAAVVVILRLRWEIQYAVGAMLLVLWLLDSWRDEVFRGLAQAGFRRLGRKS